MCVEYESFSVDPIQIDILFESPKSDFVESVTITPENFDQTLAHFDIKRLTDLRPTDLPSKLVYHDHISRPLTSTLAIFMYVCLVDVWAHQFDKLKRALTYAALHWWMYFCWFQLFASYCLHVIESCSCLYDKLLHALMGFDLHNNL